MSRQSRRGNTASGVTILARTESHTGTEPEANLAEAEEARGVRQVRVRESKLHFARSVCREQKLHGRGASRRVDEGDEGDMRARTARRRSSGRQRQRPRGRQALLLRAASNWTEITRCGCGCIVGLVGGLG